MRKLVNIAITVMPFVLSACNSGGGTSGSNTDQYLGYSISMSTDLNKVYTDQTFTYNVTVTPTTSGSTGSAQVLLTDISTNKSKITCGNSQNIAFGSTAQFQCTTPSIASESSIGYHQMLASNTVGTSFISKGIYINAGGLIVVSNSGTNLKSGENFSVIFNGDDGAFGVYKVLLPTSWTYVSPTDGKCLVTPSNSTCTVTLRSPSSVVSGESAAIRFGKTDISYSDFLNGMTDGTGLFEVKFN